MVNQLRDAANRFSKHALRRPAQVGNKVTRPISSQSTAIIETDPSRKTFLKVIDKVTGRETQEELQSPDRAAIRKQLHNLSLDNLSLGQVISILKRSPILAPDESGSRARATTRLKELAYTALNQVYEEAVKCLRSSDMSIQTQGLKLVFGTERITEAVVPEIINLLQNSKDEALTCMALETLKEINEQAQEATPVVIGILNKACNDFLTKDNEDPMKVLLHGLINSAMITLWNISPINDQATLNALSSDEIKKVLLAADPDLSVCMITNLWNMGGSASPMKETIETFQKARAEDPEYADSIMMAKSALNKIEKQGKSSKDYRMESNN